MTALEQTPRTAARRWEKSGLARTRNDGRAARILGTWLLLLMAAFGVDRSIAAEWEAGPGNRWRALKPVGSGTNGFTKLPATSLGISFTNAVSDTRSITNRNLLSGSGVAAGDVDGDGWCDLYFCGIESENRLYRNLGNWKFEDITATAGVAFTAQDSTGACFADVDGDGDLDLLVNSLGHGTRLFVNDGRGHFSEATEAAGLRSSAGSTSLALADVDGDGDLDLYVANFRPTTALDQPTARYQIRTTGGRQIVASFNGRATSEPDFTNRFEIGPGGDVLEFGQADVLYLNDGRGRFTPLAWTEGAFLNEDGEPLKRPFFDWGLAVRFYDFTGDGKPDIYVCNDLHTPDRIWVNVSENGRVAFRLIDRLAVRCNSMFSMGVDFGDLDHDGNIDFFTVDMLARDHVNRHTQLAGIAPVFRRPGEIDPREQVQRNTIHWGRGDGTFAEAAWLGGVEASDWSWGPVLLDVDLDGFEDILVTNGQLRDFQNSDSAAEIDAIRKARQLTQADINSLVSRLPTLNTPKVIFRNRGDRTFEEVGERWGFGARGISQGMCLADLDNDGDADVIMNNLRDAPGIYRNDTDAPRVAVRLHGAGANSRGIGATIRAVSARAKQPGDSGPARAGEFVQSQEIAAGGRYLSGDEPLRTFAASPGGQPLSRLEVTWRSGRRSVIPDPGANRLYELEEPGATGTTPAPPPLPAPRFEDVSQLLNHTHHENSFEDFERQPLLPRKLSQLGPGITWTDLNRDGWDDLVIGSGQGGTIAVFMNDGKGGFQRSGDPIFNRPAARDLTTILPSAGALLAGAANYEDGRTNGGCLRIYDLARSVAGDSVLGQASSAGPLAMADVDGDGTLELFIGGRAMGGRWPESPTSLLMKNEKGRFTVTNRFERLGAVSGAVFSDLDGDGDPDLVLACEWGPVRVFKNGGGRFEEATEPLGLAGFRGWWNGVTTGDFDGDGRMDIVASNWGLNSHYRAGPDTPRRLYFGDFAGDGSVGLVESYVEPGTHRELADREYPIMRIALPAVREKFGTFGAYARATVAEVVGDALKSAQRLEAETFASMLFLNRGDRFEARPLPLEAQLSPAFAVCVGDVDGDGHEDLFLSQNFFPVQPLMNRGDAGRGLWLLGDGTGNLTADPLSGVKAYGEQRGAALADFDGDGRLDLALSQNASGTKLYRNVSAKPGLRVRLRGNAPNPDAIGASIRSGADGRWGPRRELHLGAGYWSVDSLTTVLALPPAASQLEVRWPGGRTTTHPIPSDCHELEISETGEARRIR